MTFRGHTQGHRRLQGLIESSQGKSTVDFCKAPLKWMFSEAPPTMSKPIQKAMFRPFSNCPQLVSMYLRWSGGSLVVAFVADSQERRGPKRRRHALLQPSLISTKISTSLFYAQDHNFIRQRRRRHALLQPSQISTKISTSLSALMSVEADTGLCHLTRLMKITVRAT